MSVVAELAYTAGFLGWMVLIAAAGEWFRLSRRADRVGSSRSLAFSDIKWPAFTTGLALALLSVPLVLALLDHMERF